MDLVPVALPVVPPGDVPAEVERMRSYQQHADSICAFLGLNQETAKVREVATYLEFYVAGPVVEQVNEALEALNASPDSSGILAAVLILNRSPGVAVEISSDADASAPFDPEDHDREF